MFHQQAVDEDISATDAAQEDQVNAVVEEGDESPREEVIAGEEEAEGVVFDKIIPTKYETQEYRHGYPTINSFNCPIIHSVNNS